MAAVQRSLEYIAKQQAALIAEMAKCERGEYSSLMKQELFEDAVAEALAKMGTDRKSMCLGLDVPHTCSRCAGVVENYLKHQADVAASALKATS